MSQRVLIADDDNDARVLWRVVAEEENLVVTEALDGREAMDILNKDTDFSLIILDVMMPYADGYEVLRYVRDTEAIKDKPVIISTADRTTRGLANIPIDGKTFFINKASGLENMKRGILNALSILQ
ncbi:MAG: response regulator [Acidobacteria bacterium]|mgnify:CR=1 FL=1|nr:response regulator [Acidobacteriota bacterium]MBK8315816.1 response regulator [Acidobacteriota bacterium]MBK9707168.1 response regulator [Acidobacteriota bacterium]